MKLSINLGQLEGGTGSQPLLLRQPIVFVLIMMLLSLAALRHGCSFRFQKQAGVELISYLVKILSQNIYISGINIIQIMI